MIHLTGTKHSGHGPDGSRRYFKGGGGGQAYYANQDKLFGTQADIATNLYNQYASYAPQALQGLQGMVQDAQSGKYTEDQRNRAGADAASAAAMERAATERQMTSMGVNPNDARFSGALRRTELGNAANLAAMKNAAGQQGDAMAWARTTDFYNSLAGMPSQSASMLASAGSGYGQMGNAMQQQSNANMQGYGQFGAQIAGGMFKADGGYIDEPRFALGGAVGGVSMPKLGDWRARPSGFQMDKMSAGDKVMAVAAPIAMQAGANALGKHVINPMMDKAGAAIGDALGGMFGGTAAAAAPAMFGAETAALGSGLSSAGTSVAGQTIGSAIGDVGLTSALATEAAGAGGATLASAGAGSAAGTAAGAGLASTAAAALPWVGGAYLLGSALDLWADGGPVPHEQPRGLRLDMTQGGPTPDIGTETSDEIPAWLSKGEYVINADAVEEVGRDKLEKINERGLKKRYGTKAGKAKAKAMKGGKA